LLEAEERSADRCGTLGSHGRESVPQPVLRRPRSISKEDTVQKHKLSAVFAVVLAAIAVIVIAATWAPGAARAQQQQPQGVERKILRRQDLSMPGWEAVMIQTTMQPGGTEGWHTHPGTLVEYVMQDPWTMERRGKPKASYQTGETFSIVEGEVHQAINPGKTAVRGLAILMVDKSKPMTTQVQ
jgi:quercetin dioxygenase-like cupin family protein